MECEPPVPKLPWTRLEIVLLAAGSAMALIGLAVLTLGWRASPTWADGNLRFGLLLCACYALLVYMAARPPLYGRGGPIVRVSRANVRQQARVLRNVVLWLGLEVNALLVIILTNHLAREVGRADTWFADPRATGDLLAAAALAPPITVIVGLIAAYRAR